MGFLLAGNGLLVLYLTILVYKRVRALLQLESFSSLFSWLA